jgi:hypothetical protein
VSRVSYGFLVGPNTGLKVCDPAPNSGVLVFPITTAPACLSRATCGASKSGDEGGEERRAEGRPDSRRLGQVLHRDRQAVQRPGEGAAGGPRIEPGGHGGRLLGGERDDRVDRRVSLVDPGQHGGEQFGGGELPGPDQPGELNGRGRAQVHRSGLRRRSVSP